MREYQCFDCFKPYHSSRVLRENCRRCLNCGDTNIWRSDIIHNIHVVKHAINKDSQK